MTKNTKNDTTADLAISHADARRIVEAVAEYEGRRDLADGVLTLPALRPLVARWRFHRSLDHVSDALFQLRGEFDRGQTDPAVEPQTLAGHVLDSLASYVSCVADDGTWSEETFSGLRNTLERVLTRGVTDAELQSLKDKGDDAGVTRALRGTPVRDLMRVQGGQSTPWVTPPSTYHSGANAQRRQRIARFVAPIDGVPHTVVEAVREATERCGHFADSTAPGAHLSADPCPRCGRYYVDEDDVRDRVVDGIFERVTAAMQPAEEMGGPEGAQYVALMERIAHEAQRRAERAREQLAAKDTH